MASQKYYAVYQGREGTQLYTTWEQAKANVSRVPNVIYKSFRSVREAQAWLQGVAEARAAPLVPPPTDEATNQGAGPGPFTMARQAHPTNGSGNSYHAMDVDDDSDIEILDGPPPQAQWSGTTAQTPSRTVPVYDNASDDSDIEILSGPPPGYENSFRNGSTPSREPSTPSTPRPQQNQRQQTPSSVPSTSRLNREPTPAPLHAQQNGIVKTEEPTETGLEPHAPIAPAGMLMSGPTPDIQLSPDQLYVLGKVKNGESVFFTGSAGTGKSVLLRKIIEHFGGRSSKILGVTASTGIASINIGGCTLHSWAGIGLGKDDKDVLVAKILNINARAYKAGLELRRELWARKNRGESLTEEELEFLHTDPSEACRSKVLDRWRKVKTLIIDESACLLCRCCAARPGLSVVYGVY
ncbi:PIF1-like helicase-domain-containing protein [Daedaleopsis nitida]|nr:PIF1-like helicase-domain-containing protein [Daedaleopsis nitida]